MSKKLFVLMSVIVMAAMLLTACGPTTPQTVVETQVVTVKETVVVMETAAPPATDPLVGLGLKVAAVLPGPVNDAGWTTSAYLGLVHLRDAYGYEIAYTENVKGEDAPQILREYAEAGYDVVMAHGFEYADAIYQVAQEYPDTKFFHTNGSADDLANLYTVTFSAGEGGYFMGRLGCQITQSGKIAYVAGTQFPILDHHIAMSRQACADIGKGDVEVIESYVGSWWGDTSTSYELAKAAIEQGVDVLILEADAADAGTVQAAQEAYDAGKYIRVISWVKDKNYLAPNIVIGGWNENVAEELYYAMRLIATGEPGGHYAIGIAEGAVELNPFYGLVPPEVEADIISAYQGYIADPTSLPNLVVRTDL